MLKKTFLTFAFLTVLTTYFGLRADFSQSGIASPVAAPSESEEPAAAELSAPEAAPAAISVYDELMRIVSEETGKDWRLLSAIAYHESRFTPDIVSKRGAAGLMQIMPSVARSFDVEGDRILDPETNLRLAARLLSEIERSLKFSESTPQQERMRFILASYNGGIGHVKDARRLAAAHGENPDSWEVVARYLALKAEPDYYNSEVVRCGRFTGSRQTAAYVDAVLSRYDRYCSQTPANRFDAVIPYYGPQAQR